MVNSLRTRSYDAAQIRAVAPKGGYTYRRRRGHATGLTSAAPAQPLPESERDDPMARYIDDILQPGEKLLYSTNIHWIYYLPAIVAWLVAAALLVVAKMFIQDVVVLFCLAAAAIIALAALYLSLRAWFRRWTTETDVTNLRVVHKEGFIRRQTFEMSLDKVESVDVSQSIMGRLLNYGDVTILGVGEGRKTIETIASPLTFRNFITAR